MQTFKCNSTLFTVLDIPKQARSVLGMSEEDFGPQGSDEGQTGKRKRDYSEDGKTPC